jgi:hypothetical protein
MRGVKHRHEVRAVFSHDLSGNSPTLAGGAETPAQQVCLCDFA